MRKIWRAEIAGKKCLQVRLKNQILAGTIVLQKGAEIALCFQERRSFFKRFLETFISQNLSFSVNNRLELDFNIHTRRKVQMHQLIDRGRGRIQDVNKALVRAHLELLARILILVR